MIYKIECTAIMTIGEVAIVEIEAESEDAALAQAANLNCAGRLPWREDWSDQADPTEYVVIDLGGNEIL
jgi:hypothetical protein